MTEDWRIAILALILALAPTILCNGREPAPPAVSGTAGVVAPEWTVGEADAARR